MFKDFMRFLKKEANLGSDFSVKRKPHSEQNCLFLVNKIHTNDRIKKMGRVKLSEKELLGNKDKDEEDEVDGIKLCGQPASSLTDRRKGPWLLRGLGGQLPEAVTNCE